MTLTAALYWVDILDSLNSFISLIGIVLLGGIILVLVTNDSIYDDITKKVTKLSLIAAVLFGITVFIPSKNTMYMMLASSYLSTTTIPSKAEEALEVKLDSIIKDLKK
jgi:uncharacterized membrane protein YraQ (UPF0718 family)